MNTNTVKHEDVVQQVSLTPLRLLVVGQICFTPQHHFKCKVIRQTLDSTTLEVLDTLPPNVINFYTRSNDELYLAEPRDLDEALTDLIEKHKIVMQHTEDFEESSVVEEPKRRGRPKGSVNKPKFVVHTDEVKEIPNNIVIEDITNKTVEVVTDVKKKRGRPAGSKNTATQVKEQIANFKPAKRGRKPRVAVIAAEAPTEFAPEKKVVEVIAKPKKTVTNKTLKEANCTDALEMLNYAVAFVKGSANGKTIGEIVGHLHKVYPDKHPAHITLEFRSIADIDNGEHLIRKGERFTTK